MQIQPVTPEIADSLGLKKAEGALVAEPQKDSPAVKAGIEAGDVIITVDGKPVADARELARKIGSHGAGNVGQARPDPQRRGEDRDADTRRTAERMRARRAADHARRTCAIAMCRATN